MYVKLFSVTKAILEMAGHGHSLSQSVRLLKILNLRFDLYCSYHIPDACIVVGAFIAQGLRELFIILVFVRTVLTITNSISVIPPYHTFNSSFIIFLSIVHAFDLCAVELVTVVLASI